MLPEPASDEQSLLVLRGVEDLAESDEALGHLRAAVQKWLAHEGVAVLILLRCARSMVQNFRGSALIDDARRLKPPICAIEDLCPHDSSAAVCDCADVLVRANANWGLARRWALAIRTATSGNEKRRSVDLATIQAYRDSLAMLPPRIVSELHYYLVNQGRPTASVNEMDSGTPGALIEVGVCRLVDDGELDLNPWFKELPDVQSCVIAHMRDLANATQQDREIWDGLFTLERRLRILVAGHIESQSIALPDSLIEVAIRRLDGPGSPLDPLDYVSLDQLLETARDLGVRPPLGDARFWDRALIELVPVRNRSAHFRYSHPNDLQRVRQYGRLLETLEAKE